MSSRADTLTGTELAGHHVERLLGNTGAISSYAALDRQGTRVELRLTEGAEREYREHALRTMERAASLQHPNVRRVLAAGEAGGALWVAVEHVDGVDLASLREREGPLDPERAVALVAQVADAVDTARFARGLVHGNLTPSAVVVTRHDERAFVDFGTAAPPHATPLDDVRALGRILRHSVAEGVSPAPLLDVVDEAAALETRFSTCRDLAAAAAGALARCPTPPSPTARDVAADPGPAPPASIEHPTPMPASPRKRRRPVLIAAVVAAAVLAASGTVGAILLLGDNGATRADDRPELGGGATPAEEGLNLAAGSRPGLLPGSVVQIDTALEVVRVRIAIPSPRMLAADGRSLWVVGGTGGSGALVAHVDMSAVSVTEFWNSQTTPSTVAAAGGRLWIGDAHGNVHRLRDGARLDGPNLFGDSLAAAAGSVWLSWFPESDCCEFPPDLHRVHPATGRVLARIDGLSQVVAAGDGFVWAVEDNRRDVFEQLVLVDTSTHVVRRIGNLGFDWGDLAGVGSTVWASRPRDGAIVRLDRLGRLLGQPITLGRREGSPPPQPTAIAVGAGSVWVAVPDDRVVARYVIGRRQLTRIPLAGRPIDLVFAGGSLWVALDERPGRLAPAPPERPAPDVTSG
jgi:hypothetical protein